MARAVTRATRYQTRRCGAGSALRAIASERELHAKLQLAHRRSRTVDGAVQRTRHRHLRIAPDRVIEHVEGFEPELQALAPAQRDVANERHVRVEDPRPGDDVAPRVPISERVGTREGSGIEPLLDRLRTIVGILTR